MNMRRTFAAAAVGAMVLVATSAAGLLAGGLGDGPATQPAARGARSSGEGRAARDGRLSPRERAFKAALDGSVLVGTWQMTAADEKQGGVTLTEAKTDRYTIAEVNKSTGDFWVVSARVEYGDKDVTIPVTVKVVWAGDTPVITLDKSALPGLGTYSARVVMDVETRLYAGTWSGVQCGGVLSGQIRMQAASKEPATKP